MKPIFRFIIILSASSLIWAILSFREIGNSLGCGFVNLGFPFVFNAYCCGKCTEPGPGFMGLWLVLDLLIVLCFSGMVFWLTLRNKKNIGYKK